MDEFQKLMGTKWDHVWFFYNVQAKMFSIVLKTRNAFPKSARLGFYHCKTLLDFDWLVQNWHCRFEWWRCPKVETKLAKVQLARYLIPKSIHGQQWSRIKFDLNFFLLKVLNPNINLLIYNINTSIICQMMKYFYIQGMKENIREIFDCPFLAFAILLHSRNRFLKWN